jgi:2-keto-4-pentenoate hydratase
MPSSLAAAYAIQDAAIDLWPDDVSGWKIGLIHPDYRARFGADRIAGPIFSGNTVIADGDARVDLPVFEGGFGAIEAEFILRIGRDAPPDRTEWTLADAAALVDAVHVGIESAGSPFPEINDHGPAVTASDFGNNAGLVVGPQLKDWDAEALTRFTAETRINDVSVGRGDASMVPGGPMAALAFVLGVTAARGRPLRKGQWISTGAVTGVHTIKIGEMASAHFGDAGTLLCRAVRAEPRRTDRDTDRRSMR